MQQRELSKLVELRVIIGFLGETDSAPWWSCGFKAPTSGAYLAPIFPRSLTTARYQALCLAAQRVHDKHVGIGEVLHLFRLPDDLEQLLHDAVRDPRDGEVTLPASAEEAITILETLAASSSVKADGPVRIGRPEDVHVRSTWIEAAGLYLNAFVTGHQVHPYLSDR